MPPAGFREEVLAGVSGDALGFGADRVGERLVPDLVSELIWLRTTVDAPSSKRTFSPQSEAFNSRHGTTTSSG